MRAPFRTFFCFLIVSAFAQSGMGEPDSDKPSPGNHTLVITGKAESGDAEPGDVEPEKATPKQEPGQSGKRSGKSGNAKSEKAKDGPKSKERPSKPPVPPKPEELKVMPDEKGKLRFNFNGQPWPAVLEWLAKVSEMSLDWQELPGDYLNLSTQRSYSVQETRDLINSHLLTRGYTILRQGEVLHVVNIQKVDRSLVPRLSPAELDQRDPHEFAKVSFPLEWLMAATAVDELKPMLSPNGKLTALTNTNRVEAMDAVINLREIYSVLKAEQSGDSQKRLVREFVLQHARASEVLKQLQTLLGIERKAETPMPQNQQEQAQRQAEMMARRQQQEAERAQSGQPGQQPGAAGRANKAIMLVVNDHKNSILANALPDKMAIIVQAIEALDVPNDRGQSLVGNMSRMQVYRLTGIDPEPLVKTLEQMGNLDPTTRLEVDKKNKAIIAYASLADHVTIRAVVSKLSGSERSFAVRRLRRLQADYVAGTIAFMLGVQPKKQQKERRNPWSYFGGGETETTNERPNEFRVDADLDRNRLLLWANEIELTEVDNLLVKLGEISPKREGADTRRTIDTGDPKEAEALIERIRQTWPTVSPNPLQLPPPAPKKKEREATPPRVNPSEDAVAPPKTAVKQSSRSIFRLADLRTDGEKEEADLSASPAKPTLRKSPPAKNLEQTPPPIKLSVDADGRITISSDDTEALDRLEDLAAELGSPRKDFEVFHLKFAVAYSVALNLEEFFREDKEKKKPMPWWYGGDNSSQDDTADDRRLSKRRKLKFISDSETNSILVEGADQSQMATIKELIAVYDQQPPRDTRSIRKHEVICLRYAKADVVAGTVKEVFRDLLSANDKALANAPGQQKDRTIIFDYGGSDDTGKSDQRTPKYKGVLSIGIDDRSNTLVVSAPAYFFDTVVNMIKDLDEAAADNTVRVVKVGAGISATCLQDVLNTVLDQGSSHEARGSRRPTRPRGDQPAEKTGSASGSHSSDKKN